MSLEKNGYFYELTNSFDIDRENGRVDSVYLKLTLNPQNNLISEMMISDSPSGHWDRIKFQYEKIDNINAIKTFPYDYKKVDKIKVLSIF